MFSKFEQWLDGPVHNRWVVLDVETSGLDPHRDRLLAIAAVAMEVSWTGSTIALIPGDSFEVVLQQASPSSVDNILLHGIGGGAQLAGAPATDALSAFLDYAGPSPLVAFHAPFDEAVLNRTLLAKGLKTPDNPWLDIAQLCRVCHSGLAHRALDEWLDHFGLVCDTRHQAASDAWVEAQLLQLLWPKIAAQCANFKQVRRLARQSLWLP